MLYGSLACVEMLTVLEALPFTRLVIVAGIPRLLTFFLALSDVTFFFVAVAGFCVCLQLYRSRLKPVPWCLCLVCSWRVLPLGASPIVWPAVLVFHLLMTASDVFALLPANVGVLKYLSTTTTASAIIMLMCG